MTLSIKDKETDRLARRLADLSGVSITEAVRAALEAEIIRIEARKRTRLSERLLAIGERVGPQLRAQMTSADHGDFLYGAGGLPE